MFFCLIRAFDLNSSCFLRSNTSFGLMPSKHSFLYSLCLNRISGISCSGKLPSLKLVGFNSPLIFIWVINDRCGEGDFLLRTYRFFISESNKQSPIFEYFKNRLRVSLENLALLRAICVLLLCYFLAKISSVLPLCYQVTIAWNMGKGQCDIGL